MFGNIRSRDPDQLVSSVTRPPLEFTRVVTTFTASVTRLTQTDCSFLKSKSFCGISKCIESLRYMYQQFLYFYSLSLNCAYIHSNFKCWYAWRHLYFGFPWLLCCWSQKPDASLFLVFTRVYWMPWMKMWLGKVAKGFTAPFLGWDLSNTLLL